MSCFNKAVASQVYLISSLLILQLKSRSLLWPDLVTIGSLTAFILFYELRSVANTVRQSVTTFLTLNHCKSYLRNGKLRVRHLCEVLLDWLAVLSFIRVIYAVKLGF